MCRVRQTIQRGVAKDWIIEESEPFIHAAVAGEGEAAAAVTLDNQFVQVLAVLCTQTAQAEVIHDQQIRREETAERLLESVVHACLGELLEQHVGSAEEHVEASAHGG